MGYSSFKWIVVNADESVRVVNAETIYDLADEDVVDPQPIAIIRAGVAGWADALTSYSVEDEK